MDPEDLAPDQRIGRLALIDVLDVSMSSYWRFHKFLSTLDDPLGYEIATSEQVTKLVDVPTIVTGRIMTLDHAVAMYDALPNAELAVVPGTSHFLTQEKPHLVNALVLDFLTNEPVPTVAAIRRAPEPG